MLSKTLFFLRSFLFSSTHDLPGEEGHCFESGSTSLVLDMGRIVFFLFWENIHDFVAMNKLSEEGNLLVQRLLFRLGGQEQTASTCRRIGMEEEMPSMISSGVMNANTELSDSTSSAQSFPASKRLRPAVSIISSTKFKGVVPQQNGNWGAQIYANHQRIWLGTFKSEKDAAMAYDSAAIRLRSADSHRNFPWTKISVEEPYFQSHYSTEALLNMIRDGSYGLKFADFLRSQSKYVEREISLTPVRGHENGWLMCRQLFQKELTPSDVGKLNRLVIPKKYAVKYFPQFSECEVENAESDKADDRQLVFYDRLMRVWTFRYCYWRSSQSFVFTRGWNRFVKENQLKTNDTIAFYICECRENAKATKTFCMIDVNKGEHHGAPLEVSTPYIGMQMDLQVHSGHSVSDGREKVVEEEESVEPNPVCHGEPKTF